MIDLGALQVKVQAETSEAEAKLKGFGNTADGVSGKQQALNKVAGAARKAFIAYGAAIAGAYAIMKKTLGTIAAEGDEIDKQSQKLGVTAEQYQTLSLAADHCGTSMSTMSKATTKAMDAGYGSVYEYLDELMKIPDAADRMAKAQETLGTRTANELAPLIKGTQSIEDYRNELEKLGYYSDEAVASSAAYEDALTSLNQTMVRVKSIIGEQVLPVATDLINKVTDFVVNNKDKITNFFTTVSNAMKFVIKHIKAIGISFAALGVFATITSIISAIAGIVTAVQTLLPVLAAVKAAFIALSLNPFTLVIAGIVALIAGIALLVKNWDKVKKAMSNIINKSETLSKIWNTIKKLAKNVVNFTIKTPGLELAIKGIKKLKGWWDKIKNGGTTTYKTTTTGVGGGHRIGLREVPYDGYQATLHKGETILTASETNQLGNSKKRLTSVNDGGKLTTVINLDGNQIGKSTVDFINGQTLTFNASPLL